MVELKWKSYSEPAPNDEYLALATYTIEAFLEGPVFHPDVSSGAESAKRV